MLQKVKGGESVKDKPHEFSRLLLFDVTDGRTEVKGMEYHHLQQLHSGVDPGAKVINQ